MGYQSSAILPNNSPVRIAQGQIQRTRALAQASASLEACKQLHQVSCAELVLCRGLALLVHKQAWLVWLASGNPVEWQLGYRLSSRTTAIMLQSQNIRVCQTCAKHSKLPISKIQLYMPALQEHNASCAMIELGNFTQDGFSLCFQSTQHASHTSRVMWYGASPNRTMHWLCLRILLAHHTRHIVSRLSGQLRLLCRSAASNSDVHNLQSNDTPNISPM